MRLPSPQLLERADIAARYRERLHRAELRYLEYPGLHAGRADHERSVPNAHGQMHQCELWCTFLFFSPRILSGGANRPLVRERVSDWGGFPDIVVRGSC